MMKPLLRRLLSFFGTQWGADLRFLPSGAAGHHAAQVLTPGIVFGADQLQNRPKENSRARLSREPGLDGHFNFLPCLSRPELSKLAEDTVFLRVSC